MAEAVVVKEYLAESSEGERALKNFRVRIMSRGGKTWKEYICIACGFKALTAADAYYHVLYHVELAHQLRW